MLSDLRLRVIARRAVAGVVAELVHDRVGIGEILENEDGFVELDAPEADQLMDRLTDELKAIEEWLGAVLVERDRQDAKFGQQDHPSGTGPNVLRHGELRQFAEDRANIARRRCDVASASGTLTWRHIADEEHEEAIAAADPHDEVVEFTAVGAAWLEAMRRARKTAGA